MVMGGGGGSQNARRPEWSYNNGNDSSASAKRKKSGLRASKDHCCIPQPYFNTSTTHHGTLNTNIAAHAKKLTHPYGEKNLYTMQNNQTPIHIQSRYKNSTRRKPVTYTENSLCWLIITPSHTRRHLEHQKRLQLRNSPTTHTNQHLIYTKSHLLILIKNVYLTTEAIWF
jgi:hypothetical protein